MPSFEKIQDRLEVLAIQNPYGDAPYEVNATPEPPKPPEELTPLATSESLTPDTTEGQEWTEAAIAGDNAWNEYLATLARFQGEAAVAAALERRNQSIGYQATFWSDPQRLAGYYHAIQAAPPDATLPAWMTPAMQQAITSAYEYMSYRNPGTDWTQWKWLNAKDPAVQFLQSMPAPPAEWLNQYDTDNAQFGTAEQARNQPVTLDLVTSGQAAWKQLPEDQRQAILTAPAFDITQYAPFVQQQMLADAAFDWSRLPAWRKTLFELQANPLGFLPTSWQTAIQNVLGEQGTAVVNQAATGAFQGTIMGGGNPGGVGLGAIIGTVGGITGYDQNKYFWQQGDQKLTFDLNQLRDLGAGMMGLLNDLAQVTEQSIGFALQPISAMREGTYREYMDKYGIPPETTFKILGKLATGQWTEALDILNTFPAWQAGRVTYDVGIGQGLGVRNLAREVAKFFVSAEEQNRIQALTRRMWAGELDFQTYKAEVSKVYEEVLGPAAQYGQDFVLGKLEPVDLLTPAEQEDYKNNFSGSLTDYILIKTREEIAARIEGGATMEEAVAEVMGRFGTLQGAVLGDLIGQASGDPLNIAGEASAKIKAIALTTPNLVKLGESIGKPELFKPLFELNNPKAVQEAFRAIVATLPPAEAAKLNWYQRTTAGVTTSGLQSGMMGALGKVLFPGESLGSVYEARKGIIGKAANFAHYMTALDPASRVELGFSMAVDNLRAVFSSLTPEELPKFMTALQNADLVTMKNLAGEIAGSSEFYTIVPMLKGWDKMKNLAAVWEASAFNRGHLARIAELLGYEQSRLVEALGQENGAKRIFEQIRNLLTASKDEIAKSMLEDMKNGEFGVDDLAQIGKAFNGPEALPWHPDAYKAMVMESIGDHAAQWGVNYFGIKSEKTIYRMAHALKSAQSLLLLGMNPAYALNNGINNVVTRAASGVGGFMSGKQIGAWMDRFGVTPARLREGVGALGDVSSKAAQAVNDAKRGHWLLTGLDETLRSFNKVAPFNALAKYIEQQESRQAFTIGMSKMWSKVWQPGTGFRKMDAGLEKALRALDPSMPERVYSLIQGGMNMKEVEAALRGREQGIRAQSLINEAAQTLGVKPADAATMLNQMGLAGALDAYLNTASTPAQVRAAFETVRRRAQDWMDVYHAEELTGQAEHVKNAVAKTGGLEVHKLVIDTFMARTDRWMEHYFLFDEAATLADQIPVEFEGQRSRIWEEAYSKNAREWERTNAWELATYKGIVDALGLGPDANKFTALLNDNHTLWGEAYEFARRQREAFRETWQGKEISLARTADLQSMRERVNEAFENAFAVERANQTKMRDVLVEEMRKVYGDLVAEAARQAYDQTIAFRDEMTRRLQTFRKQVEGMSLDERGAAKHEFYQNTYVPMINELGHVQQEGAEKVQRAIRFGGEGGEATGATAEPSPRPSPGGRGGEGPTTPPPTGEGGQGAGAARVETTPPAATRVGGEVARVDIAEEMAQLQRDVNTRLTDAERVETQHHAAIWNVANTEGYRAVTGGDAHLMNLVRKYAKENIAAFSELTPELVKRAMDLRRIEDERQMVMDLKPVTPEEVSSVPDVTKTPEEQHRAALQERLMQPQTVDAFVAMHPALRETVAVTLREMLAQVTEAPKTDPQALLKFINEHGGIAKDLMPDMTGETKAGKGIPPGLFRKDGSPIDFLVTRLVEEGYLSRLDVENPFDNGAVNKAMEMIRNAVGGERVYPQGAILQPDWMKGLGGKETAERNIRQMLAGVEDPSVKRVQKLKERLWSEVVANAQMDPDAMAYLKLPDERLADMAGELDLAVKLEDVDRASNLLMDIYGRLRDDTPAELQEKIFELGSQVDALSARQTEAIKAAELQSKAAQAVEKAQARREAAMTKKLLSELWTEQGYEPAQVEAYMQVFEAGLEQFARKTGVDAATLISTYYGEPVRMEAAKFLKEAGMEGMFQTPSPQPSPEGGGSVMPKGATTLGENGKFIVHAFEAADITTLVHENAHVWLEMMRDFGRTNPEIRADMRTLETWAGVTDGVWTREANEQFARGFERYMADGSAPSLALRDVFQQFKTWMLDVYHALVGSPLDVKITPEVRDVFDRMLAENPLYRVEVDAEAKAARVNEMNDMASSIREKARLAREKMRQAQEAFESLSPAERARQRAEAEQAAQFQGKQVTAYDQKIKAERAASPLGISETAKQAEIADWADFVAQAKAAKEAMRARAEAKVSGQSSVISDQYGAGGVYVQVLKEQLLGMDSITYKITNDVNAPKDGRILDTKIYQQKSDIYRVSIVENAAGERYSIAEKKVELSGSPTEVTIRFDEMKSSEIEKNAGLQKFSAKLFAEAKTADAGAVGGLLPGMQEATGMLFDVQPGTGVLSKMEAANARSVTDIVPGKTAGGFARGDIVEASGGQRYGVAGVNAQGKLVTVDGKVLDPSKAKKVAGQTPMFQAAKEPNILFQSADPRFPFGGMDQVDQFHPEGQMLDEGWTKYVTPLLDAMQKGALDELGGSLDTAGTPTRPAKTYDFASLTPEAQAGMEKYLRQVRADMPSAKLATVRFAEGMRDYAMLNYNRRSSFDRTLEMFFPYQFFTTRTAMNWLTRMVDRPAWYSQMLRLQRFSAKYERDLPERLKGKIKINAPWLPDWMGNALYVDPMRIVFPPSMFMSPFEQMFKDRNQQQLEAERVLQEWAANETYSTQEIREAVMTRSGSVWEAALAEAQVRRQAEIANPADLVATMLGPAYYLTTPYYAMTGQGNKISETPLTKTARGTQAALEGTWAEPLGNLVGLLAKPEGAIREAAGLPEFGQYGEYYIDRQLANMAADGEITAEEAKLAMIEREGEAFDMARERVAQELATRIPGFATLYNAARGDLEATLQSLPASLFGGQILPEGELRYRGLNEKWKAAWVAYDAGDTEAISRFFEDHPEYEAYLAKGQDADARLRSMLTSEIWDRYMGLNKADRRLVTAQLGADFAHSFLDSETRDPAGISVETLSFWARELGGRVPQVEATKNVTAIPQAMMPQLEGFPPATSAALNGYYASKEQMFPGITQIQDLYYGLSEGERRKMLGMFPQLTQYWDWRRTYIEQNPAAAPFISQEVADGIRNGTLDPRQFGLGPEQADRLLEYYNMEFQTPLYTADFYLKNASQPTKSQVQIYLATGAALGAGALAELRQIWEANGRPLGSFDEWMTQVIFATSGY